jgi:glutamyl-tRNA reductase
VSTVSPTKTVQLRQVDGGAALSRERCSRDGCSVKPNSEPNNHHCPFGVVGLSYRTASLDLRGRASLAGDAATRFLGMLREHGVAEAMVLSTCNRTEVYFAHPDEQLVIRLFAAAAKTDIAEIQPHLYLKKSLCAACHLFRVASGLDSQVLGETEIVAQVKQAWKNAEAFGSCGPGLGLLLQRSMEVNKRVRTETDLCKGVTSTATLAVMQAQQHLGTLQGKRVLLLGAGQIAERVCKDLLPLAIGSLTILNRSADKAQRLADYYGGTAAGLDSLVDAITDSDVVITALSTPCAVVTNEVMARSGRDQHLLIDLGVPANVEVDMPGVQVINIDGLSAACSENLGRRMSAVPVALDILDAELQRLRNDLTTRSASPTIKALVNQAEQIRQLNMEWAMERLTDLSDKERKVVEDLSNRIIKGLLQAPIQGLKHELAAAEHREIVSKLFKLEEPIDERLAG